MIRQIKEEIIEAIEQGNENIFVDFKRDQYSIGKSEVEKKKKLIKALTGMANSHYKGNSYIIIGIKDNPIQEEDYIGINEEEMVDPVDYQNIVRNSVKPELHFSYEKIKHKGKCFGVFIVFSDNKDKPYKSIFSPEDYKGYIRRDGSGIVEITNDDFSIYKSEKPLYLDGKHQINYFRNSPSDNLDLEIYLLNQWDRSITIQDGYLELYNENGEFLTKHRIDSKVINKEVLFLGENPIMLQRGESYKGIVSFRLSIKDLFKWFNINDLLNQEYKYHIRNVQYKISLIDMQDNEYTFQQEQVSLLTDTYHLHPELLLESQKRYG